MIVLLVGMVVFSAIGWSTDPHGYGIFAGTLFALILTPVAIGLWLLHQLLRRGTKKSQAGHEQQDHR
ncbi:hypothetical protein [Actinokineospora cianjurensis]|uniref:hypothetical protein n=1 Tax=Actinokineospora cianjurensis TaxID=585224 RepID=UPI001FE72C93|nr:hypothetical protein [Actinokineospora cianjurensis]